MSHDIYKLTIIGFDSMENSVSQAEHIIEEKYFKENPPKSAHGVLCDYISKLEYRHQLGWNGEVYPKFKISSVFLECGDK